MKVKKNTKIAYEDGRGGVVHTHVEVCNGRVMKARVSKDNYLENSNPTSYWNSKGYTVK